MIENNNQPVEPTMEQQTTNSSLAGESKDSGTGSSQVQSSNNVATVHDQEIRRILNDPTIGALSFDSGKRAIIDLKKEALNGKSILGTKWNRTHGSDQDYTGKSICDYGAQIPVLVTTMKVVQANGIEAVRFPGDVRTDPPKDTDYVVIDGHGRFSYLFDMEIKDWPSIPAITLDNVKEDKMDIGDIMAEINRNDTVWKAQDYIPQLLMSKKSGINPIWEKILELVKSGYTYSSACEWRTLRKGIIPKTKVNIAINNGSDKSEKDLDELFVLADQAERIFEAAKAKFGEDDDKVMKNKPIIETLIEKWDALRDKKGLPKEEATDRIVGFLNNLNDDYTKRIKDAKKMNGQTRDQVRVHLMDEAFSKFENANQSQP